MNEPTDPRLLWSVSGLNGAYRAAFSSDCRYLVSTNYHEQRIHIFDVITGRQVLERRFEDNVCSVAWWEDRIAVGLGNGRVYAFIVDAR